MSDIIDNDTEEETSGFGLGRGLDALFGDDEVMGLDDDEPAATEETAEAHADTTPENDLPAEEEGLDMAALMGEVEPSEQEQEAVAAPQQIEEPQSETEVIVQSVSETEVEVDVEIDMAAAMAEAPQEEAESTAEEQIIEAAVASESEEDLIEEIKKTAEAQRNYKSKHSYDLKKFGLTEEKIKRDCQFIYETFLTE